MFIKPIFLSLLSRHLIAQTDYQAFNSLSAFIDRIQAVAAYQPQPAAVEMGPTLAVEDGAINEKRILKAENFTLANLETRMLLENEVNRERETGMPQENPVLPAIEGYKDLVLRRGEESQQLLEYDNQFYNDLGEVVWGMGQGPPGQGQPQLEAP